MAIHMYIRELQRVVLVISVQGTLYKEHRKTDFVEPIRSQQLSSLFFSLFSLQPLLFSDYH